MHVHSCANFATIAALCHRISGVPYSLVLHGALADYGADQLFKWKDASFVFIITETLRAEVAKILPDMMGKVVIVPMGVNTDIFRPPETPRPDQPEPFMWFCCARLNRGKGYDTLIEAAVLLRNQSPELNFKICIAGEDEQGGAGYHRELDELIVLNGLEGTIELMGSVTQETVRKKLQDADGFVLASRHEALGVAYMEAMACGLPVIGTRTGGVPELIKNEDNGILVSPDSPGELSHAMAVLMRDPDLRRRLGQRARSCILDNYSARRSADALVQSLHKEGQEGV